MDLNIYESSRALERIGEAQSDFMATLSQTSRHRSSLWESKT